MRLFITRLVILLIVAAAYWFVNNPSISELLAFLVIGLGIIGIYMAIRAFNVWRKRTG